MNKKSFRDTTAHIDRFFSSPDNEPHGTHRTQEPQNTHRTHDKPVLLEPKYYRLNLKLKAEYRAYLERISWEAHKSITQYINDLIQADKDTRDT